MAGVADEAEANGSLERVEDDFNERIGQRLEGRMALDAESTQGQLSHLNWTLDDLDSRSKETGLRAATNNFQRKLYASVANMIETFENMVNMEIDVLIGTEPGMASHYNEALLIKTARLYDFDVKLSFRSRDDVQGGIVVVMSRTWAKIPSTVRRYDPSDRNLKGRLLSIEFNNKTNGQHNKVQIIGAHLVNSAHTNTEDTKKLLTWIMTEKDRFNKDNQQATSILLGDLNASESEWLDTDRVGATHDSERMEADASVIATLKDMRYADLIRTKYPTKRVVTRAVHHETNRLLDRIMVTKEVARHGASRVAVYKHSFIKAGSDHLMVAADLPIDTAGAAGDRVQIWQPYEYTKWKNKEFKTEEEREEAHVAYRTMLQSTSEQEDDDISWVQQAARACLLEPKQMMYPRKPNHKDHYTSEDWKVHGNLSAMRSMRIQMLADAIEGRDNSERLVARAKRRIVKASVVFSDQYAHMWRLAKRKNWDELMNECSSVIAEMEEHLQE